MKAREITLGISNITVHNRKAKYGPTLRLSRTIRVDLEDGRVLGDTIPGFLVIKRQNGEFKVLPPVHRLTPGATYHCALVTKDDSALILATLADAGYLKKVGTNNEIKLLADLEPDLLSDLPEHVTHV